MGVRSALNRDRNDSASAAFDLPAPIFDTPRADQAARGPVGLLSDYRERARTVWLPAEAEAMVDSISAALSKGEGPVWGTLVGAFGFGKSATLTGLWQRFDDAGIPATPPLAVTSLDELFDGCATLLATGAGARADLVQSARRQSLALGGGRVRRGADALVEFLRLLCGPEGSMRGGLVICIDELQQLLGPLDASALQDLRSLVWGLRTERVNCALLLTLDPLMYRRLDRWASDILHRIADRGYRLDLSRAYDARFVGWLWSHWRDGLRVTRDSCLDQDLQIALGQYVEREDLANGPRTVVEVFARIVEYPDGVYGLPEFVKDLRTGQFRFFSGSQSAQALISSLLDDAWVNETPQRRQLVEILAGFPDGVRDETIARVLPKTEDWERVRRELFGPLLVKGGHGPALEVLQRVRRRTWELDELILRCWETLPAFDSLMSHAVGLVSSTLVSWWFGDHAESCGRWTEVEPTIGPDRRFEGEFDPSFPDRRVRVEVRDRAVPLGPSDDAELVVRFVVCGEGACLCDLEVADDPGLPVLVTVTLPLLAPVSEMSSALARYCKFLDPEPLRPIHLLAALAEVEAQKEHPEVPEPMRLRTEVFRREVCDFLGSLLLQGEVMLGKDKRIRLSGVRLLRAQATRGLRQRYPDYRPLRRVPRWRDELSRYRRALVAPDMSPKQRVGVSPVEGAKYAVLQRLEQQSVAAGDSLVRSLESLLDSEGGKEEYRLWFRLHDLERWALAQLDDRRLPHVTMLDILQHHGCSATEADEVVSLLFARQAICTDGEGLLVSCLPKNDECDGADRESNDRKTPEIEARASIEDSLERVDRRLIEVLAQLRALEKLAPPLSGSLSKHLKAHVLDTTRRIEGTIAKAKALRSRCAKSGAVVNLGEIERRTHEAEEMLRRIVGDHARCKQWLHASVLLSALERRAERLKIETSGALTDARHRLAECIRRWRERFATNGAGALAESRGFIDEIQAIEKSLDAHQLDERIAFDRRRKDFVEGFSWAATRPAPWGLDAGDPTPFDSLDRWVLEAAELALSRLESAYRPGGWQDPMKTQVTFRELHTRFAQALALAQADLAAIDDLRALERRLRDGFKSAYQLEHTYNDPSAGPDFGQLAQAFANGEIELIVRARRSESGS